MAAARIPADRARRLSASGLPRVAAVSAALLVVTLTGCQHAVKYAALDAFPPGPSVTPAGSTSVATAGSTLATAAAPTAPYAGPLCQGWGGSPVSGQLDPCSVVPYTTHNYENHWAQSYWNGPAVQ